MELWAEAAVCLAVLCDTIFPIEEPINAQAQKRRKILVNLEEKIRDWAIADSAIIIICGPIITRQPKTIGKNTAVLCGIHFDRISPEEIQRLCALVLEVCVAFCEENENA